MDHLAEFCNFSYPDPSPICPKSSQYESGSSIAITITPTPAIHIAANLPTSAAQEYSTEVKSYNLQQN